MSRVTAVIFDWAGTTVDHGSLAPVRTLQKLFAGQGIAISEREARRDMGIPKKEHIRALLQIKGGRPPAEADVQRLFEEFIPMQMECLAKYSAVIPGVAETVKKLRARGIRIGSTTGYTRPCSKCFSPALPSKATRRTAPSALKMPAPGGLSRGCAILARSGFRRTHCTP